MFKMVINGFRFRSYTVKAERDAMRNELRNLKQHVPFAENSRFPENGIFINLNHSVPGRLIRNMTMALDVSDRQVEKDRPHETGTGKRVLSNLEDGKVAFYNSLEGLTDLLGSRAIEYGHTLGIYIQSTFESETGLTWTA
ncbi:hypothetical protein ABEL47_22780 [Escherichia coli]